MNDKRVVITGIGPLASIGFGKDYFWRGILEKNLSVKRVKDKEIPVESYLAYKIDNFDITDFVDKKIIEDIKRWKEGEDDKALYYAIAAVKLALDDSNLKYKKAFNNIGVVFTNENPGIGSYAYKVINYAYEFIRKNIRMRREEFVRKWIELFDKPTYELQTFMPLYHLTKAFGFHGYSLFVNNACASGLYAIELAAQIIKKGMCSVVIIVGSEVCDVFKYLWFKDIGLYSLEGVIRPFSKRGTGFVIGEGAAAIVMEALDFAKKRKAHIYGEYLGGGFYLEGWKVTLPAVGRDFYERSIKKALDTAGVAKEKIDLIIPHGVGVPLIDKYEIRGIEKVFGKIYTQPLISAFKPYIGHTLGINSLLEVIILLLTLNNEIIPPVLNFSPLISKLNIVKKIMRKRLKYVMKITSAFAGYLGACVFGKCNG